MTTKDNIYDNAERQPANQNWQSPCHLHCSSR